jgi:hypothetical protein
MSPKATCIPITDSTRPVPPADVRKFEHNNLPINGSRDHGNQ